MIADTLNRAEATDTMLQRITSRPDTPRGADLRARVRAAMEAPALAWEWPARIADRYMAEPLAVRKARAIAGSESNTV